MFTYQYYVISVIITTITVDITIVLIIMIGYYFNHPMTEASRDAAAAPDDGRNQANPEGPRGLYMYVYI